MYDKEKGSGKNAASTDFTCTNGNKFWKQRKNYCAMSNRYCKNFELIWTRFFAHLLMSFKDVARFERIIVNEEKH